MCEWCENGRLKRVYYGGVEKDHAKYLHRPEGRVPVWWEYQHVKALRLVEIEKKKDETAARLTETCLCCEKPLSQRAIKASGFCSVCYQRVKRWQKKWQLIERLGGRCVRCGWEPTYAAQMDFHHRDPAEKSFNIGEHINVSFEVLWAEVKKCELLCANCHRAEEQGFNEEVYSLFGVRRAGS